jgi:hypothetical protein
MRTERPTFVVKVSELRPMDKIAYGSLLGSVKAADDLTVKSIEPADMGRYALTLYRVGTIFVNGDQPLEILDIEDRVSG